MSLTLGRFVEFPRAAPSGIPQTSLGFRGHLITNFPHIMVILLINLKNSLIIQEQNTKKNHKRVVVLYVIKNHVNLHKL
jgi:hypothetical protein